MGGTIKTNSIQFKWGERRTIQLLEIIPSLFKHFVALSNLHVMQFNRLLQLYQGPGRILASGT